MAQMRTSNLIAAFIAFFCTAIGVAAQAPTPTPSEETLKVDTRLIQSGFQVYGRDDRPVSGLTKGNFELRIDGKPVEIKFVEEVGSPGSTLSASTSGQTAVTTTAAIAGTRVRRTIMFLVDDLHLQAPNLIRTRRMLQKFVDDSMLPDDRIAIVSSGGKVGFLQQFTSDRDVLKAAIARLVNGRGISLEEAQEPKMDEYAAQTIVRGDREITNYFVSQTMAIEKISLRPMAESIVQNRARNIMLNAHILTSTSLSALEGTLQAGGRIPGRKVIQFITDGFLLDPGNTDASDRLKLITDAATRTNTVINSFDAKGLDGFTPEETTLLGASIKSGSRFEMGDGPSYVAGNTGGRFVRNTNDITGELLKTTSEAFHYYLLAWEPENESAADNKLRKIELKVISQPGLKVRAHRGFLPSSSQKTIASAVEKSSPKADPEKPKEKLPPAIPTALNLRYVETSDDGPSVAATLQIGLGSTQDKRAELAIDFEIVDANGKTVKTETRPLSLDLPQRDEAEGDLQFNYDYAFAAKPGLYQVKATTRDVRSGRKGSTYGWIDLPDIAKHRIALSGIVLGERGSEGALIRKVVNRFSTDSSLHFGIFAYVAPQKGDTPPPNLSLQISVEQNGRPVTTSTSNLAVPDADEVAAIPYKGEINLKVFAAGSYELVIVLNDARGKRSAEKRVSFDVD